MALVAVAALVISLLSVELSGAMLASAPQPPVSADATVALTDDDRGSAMFDVDNLVPGRPVTRCITVSYAAGDDPAKVWLFAEAVGDLSPYLSLVVETGSGGSFRDCTSFSGTVVYQGTLDQFATAHGAAETSMPTLSTSGAQGSRTFRFTLEPHSLAEAQGEAATATFTWLLDSAAQPVSAEPIPAEPAPGAHPASPRASRPALGPGEAESPAVPRTHAGPSLGPATPAAASYGEVRRPVDADRRRASLYDDARPTATNAESASAAVGHNGGLGDLFAALGRALRALAEKSALPLLLLAIMLLFLLVQDRIDRRDPKLLLAPIERHPDLEFRPLIRHRVTAS